MIRKMLRVLFLLGFSLFLDRVCSLGVVCFGFLMFFFNFNYSFFKALVVVKVISYRDTLTVFFILFSFLLIILILCFSFCLRGVKLKLYNVLAIFLLGGLIFFFRARNVFKFYLFFEFSFIIMVLYILLWGVNPERIRAVNYLLVYTFLGSLPLLLVRITIYFFYFSTGGFYIIRDPRLVPTMPKNLYYMNSYFFFLWVIAFLIKMPIFGFHLWLPKAHVEAPVFGSMLLAGVMLKVGVFGLFRILFVFCRFKFFLLYFLVVFFSLGLIFLNLICLRQFDLKSFVAYSSVVHMSLISIRVWLGRFHRIVGRVLLCFAHGFCSSGLFLGVKKIYISSGTRKILLNRGFLYLLPVFVFLWFLLCACNCSLPVSLKFISEVLLVSRGLSYFNGVFLIFLYNVFFCGLYCVYLYVLVRHGKISNLLKFTTDSSGYLIVYIGLFYHLFLIYFFFVFMSSFTGVM